MWLQILEFEVENLIEVVDKEYLSYNKISGHLEI